MNSLFMITVIIVILVLVACDCVTKAPTLVLLSGTGLEVDANAEYLFIV